MTDRRKSMVREMADGRPGAGRDDRRADADMNDRRADEGSRSRRQSSAPSDRRADADPNGRRPNADTYIRMDDLSVGYNGKAIIRDICIDIKKGEIVTLIGPNGAGKSTILKSITRQLTLISGKVIFDEADLHRMNFRELSQKMAVVLTERLKTDLLTCYDIVASGRYPYTGKLGLLTEEDERMVDEAMAVVDATELGPKDFNAISDGQRQRVLLARAICQDPEIIILDEPTSFLDIRYKLELLSILRNMAKKKGITVIMSLHEIDLAEKISDRIICVKGDRIFRYGPPEEIFREEMIRQMYELDNGFFDPLLGSIELPAPTGKGWGGASGAAEEDAPDAGRMPSADHAPNADSAPSVGRVSSTDCAPSVGRVSSTDYAPSADHASSADRVSSTDRAPDGADGTGGASSSDGSTAGSAAPDAPASEAPSPEALAPNAPAPAQVLVISSGGTGIPVYRTLQKQNIPFIAGILYPNDIDYQVARLLAAEVIITPAFEEIGVPAFARAEEVIKKCGRVIVTDFPIGTMNRRIADLIEMAGELGKLERA